MLTSISIRWLAAGLLGSAATQAGVRPLALNPRATDAFASVASVVELSDGSLLVSDPVAQTVWVVAADRSRRARVTGTIQSPGGLYRRNADTVLVFDRARTEFVKLTPSGTPVPAPMVVGATVGRINLSDDVYRLDDHDLIVSASSAQASETTVVVRRSPSGSVDTVGHVRSAPRRRTQLSPGVITSLPMPFAPEDDWAPGPDGSIVIAHADPYYVERRLRDGRVHRGKPVEVEWAAVSAQDREEVGKRIKATLARFGLPESTAPQLPDSLFPMRKPPVAPGSMRVGPDGFVWVHRQGAHNAEVQLVDVFGPDAEWRETVSLPSGARIVGLSEHAVYVSVPDGDQKRLSSHTRR